MGLRERIAGIPGAGEPSGKKPVLDELERKYHYRLVEELGRKLDSYGAQELKDKVTHKVEEYLATETTPLSMQDREDLIRMIVNDVIGYGPLEPFLADPEVTEIMINNPDTIYIERAGKLHPTDGKFLDEAHLMRIIDKIVAQVGRRVDESVPMVDARLPDGSRVNAIIHPLAINGPMLTIRKFTKGGLTVDDLVRFGTLTNKLGRLLEICVRGKLNVIVSGGTGTGKTTTLNALSAFIPSDERIITIEDAAELKLRQSHVLRLEARPPNIEGKGAVAIRDLVRNALRMRPDRIVVGEVRGGEALDMLQAMNTGHDGSLSTVHANSPRDVLSRLETMVLMSGMNLPIRAIRQQIASAIDLVIHQSRLRDGTRRITDVTEVVGMEGDIITLQDIFQFDYGAGVDERGRYKGHVKATGIRPKFMEKLVSQGFVLQPDVFEPESMAA